MKTSTRLLFNEKCGGLFACNMSSKTKKSVVAAAVTLLIDKKRRTEQERQAKRKKRNWIPKREEHGVYAKLLIDLLHEDRKSYKKLLRMGRQDYEFLLFEY